MLLQLRVFEWCMHTCAYVHFYLVLSAASKPASWPIAVKVTLHTRDHHGYFGSVKKENITASDFNSDRLTETFKEEI